MSTTTNFKRIALVAVAALGLGVLSSVPTNAAIVSDSTTLTLTSNGTATKAISDSTTSAKFRVSMLATAADSFTLSVTNKTKPATAATAPTARFYVTDTAGSTAGDPGTLKPAAGIYNSDTSVIAAAAATGYTNVGYGLFMDSGTGNREAGTYVYTVIATYYSTGAVIAQKSLDVSLVIAAIAADSKVASARTSTAYMSEGASFVAGTVVDSTIALPATASATDQAVIKVTLLNESSLPAEESITVTTTAGVVGSAGVYGRSITLAYSGSAIDIDVRADGTAGVASIVIAAKSFTFLTKNVTFYGDPATITAGVYSSVIGTSGIGVWGTAKDSKSNDLAAGTVLYAYSSDTSVINSFGAPCGAYDSTLKVVPCTLTGVKAGTANITLRDAATVAASTVASNAVAVRVSLSTAASYKVTTSANSFAPGQPGVILVTVYDAAGAVMPAGTYGELFTSSGITPSLAMGASINGTLSSASVTTASNPVASATKPVVTTDPVMQYYYYMPSVGGTLALAHKGGNSLPVAAQVSGTTPVTITDSGAAALAAVTALATTVASLRTLIVTLTNLVLKIQKKVRA